MTSAVPVIPPIRPADGTGGAWERRISPPPTLFRVLLGQGYDPRKGSMILEARLCRSA